MSKVAHSGRTALFGTVKPVLALKKDFKPMIMMRRVTKRRIVHKLFKSAHKCVELFVHTTTFLAHHPSSKTSPHVLTVQHYQAAAHYMPLAHSRLHVCRLTTKIYHSSLACISHHYVSCEPISYAKHI
jgi:hypothetical protein